MDNQGFWFALFVFVVVIAGLWYSATFSRKVLSDLWHALIGMPEEDED